MHLLLRFIVSVIALYITVYAGRALGLHLYLAPGFAGIEGAGLAALILGIVNAVIAPILKLVALPITCLTLGLFSVVINAILFWVVGQITPNYHVQGAMAALFGTIVMSLVGGVLNLLIVPSRERAQRKQPS